MQTTHILFEKDNYHKGSIICAAWNTAGNMLATGSQDAGIRIQSYDIDPNDLECAMTGMGMSRFLKDVAS